MQLATTVHNIFSICLQNIKSDKLDEDLDNICEIFGCADISILKSEDNKCTFKDIKHEYTNIQEYIKMINAKHYHSRLDIHKYWERYVLPYGSKARVIRKYDKRLTA